VAGPEPDVPRHRFVRAGGTLVAVAAAGMAVVAQPWAPAWPAYAVWVTGGLGMGLAMSSISVLLLAQSPEAERGANSAALQVADFTSAALLIGAAGALVAASTRGALSVPAAAGIVNVAMLGVAALGALLAGRTQAPVAVR